jgi:hypothetical protein
MWDEHVANRRLQALPRPRLHRRCQGEPGLAILPMDDKGGRILLLAIHQKDYHLAAACLRSVIWTLTISMCQAGDLQIERRDDAQACVSQFFSDPLIHLLTSLL